MSERDERDERAELTLLMLGRTATDATERILAAGYRKPRTVTTVEELDALPVGSVILDRDGMSLHKTPWNLSGTGWNASNGTLDVGREELEAEALPATVLHEPGQP